LWLHATSWAPWLDRFRDDGYDPIAPGWPDEPPTVAEARAHPDAVASLGIGEITEHYAHTIERLDRPPIIVGHSFGGLFAEKLLGEGHGVAAVAIDPAQSKGVLPLPLAQLRAGLPALSNPASVHKAISLTAKEFRFGFANAVTEEESNELYEKWTIPSPAKPLFQAAVANFSLHSPAKVNTGNVDRGPLLLISGTADHTVPHVVARSTMKQYRASTAVTELKQFEGRGPLAHDRQRLETGRRCRAGVAAHERPLTGKWWWTSNSPVGGLSSPAPAQGSGGPPHAGS
jgi:pimeloyl-ACP methyl ester carboxylesterase